MTDVIELRTDTGVTYPRGYRAAGMNCGIRPDRPDLAIVVSDEPAVAAGVFTRNVFAAAPVDISRAHIHSENVCAILVNAGNANAATGQDGYDRATRCVEETAYRLGCAPAEVLVASTGKIGVPLPDDTIIAALDELIAAAGRDGGAAAADAIMTTDTHRKMCACDVELSGGTVRIGAMAKGSGMIMPAMATMLAFVTTDARIPRDRAQALDRKSVV